jgi:hypothetical protein
MMRNFRHTVECSRAATTATTDAFGNTTGENRPEVTFVAAFVPPTTQLGSQIVDGPLRETTITKPTLMIDRRAENAAALVPGALRSGDYVTVNGDPQWQVDGDPADFTHPWTGWQPPLVVELRKRVG